MGTWQENGFIGSAHIPTDTGGDPRYGYGISFTREYPSLYWGFRLDNEKFMLRREQGGSSMSTSFEYFVAGTQKYYVCIY